MQEEDNTDLSEAYEVEQERMHKRFKKIAREYELADMEEDGE